MWGRQVWAKASGVWLAVRRAVLHSRPITQIFKMAAAMCAQSGIQNPYSLKEEHNNKIYSKWVSAHKIGFKQ